MSRKLTREDAAAMAARRKIRKGGRWKIGPRCPCGAMSTKRAVIRYHFCIEKGDKSA
jgi:hypothetical protein